MAAYSVLMSVYYKEKAKCLVEAIESMLHQTLPPTDFVIVCDGTLTPELDKVIESYKKKYPLLFQIIRFSENKGLGLALAQGLQYCKNEIVARMDSDDISVSNRMELQMQVMCSNDNISAVGGQILEFDGEITNIVGQRKVPCDNKEIREMIRFRNPMNHMTVVFRKSRVFEAGNYQHLIGYEDYLLWAKMIGNNDVFINLEHVLCYVRVDISMYMRRGGWKYFVNSVKLQNHLLIYNIVNRKQYVRNIIVRFIGSVLLPNKLRAFLYCNLLRSK